VRLARTLDAVVEDCVNAVGVDLNTASVPLLTRVSGLTTGIAENIVRYREENGPFRSRRELMRVNRLGDKTFEQAAGFLRITDGEHPLDASAVHPEAYGWVEALAERSRKPLAKLIGDTAFVRSLNPAELVDERFGEPTVRDILAELEKPGRDPRPAFTFASFREGVEKLEDLEAGMKLEGNVTNVTNFGAFVDVGVHQDGLVHISALSHSFVKDPREVVRAGDVVTVKVISVDRGRRRIELSMRLADEPGKAGGNNDHKGVKPAGKSRRNKSDRNGSGSGTRPESAGSGTMAQAFARARGSNDKQ